jgi:hypothetical protein
MKVDLKLLFERLHLHFLLLEDNSFSQLDFLESLFGIFFLLFLFEDCGLLLVIVGLTIPK